METNTLIIEIEKKITANRDKISDWTKTLRLYEELDRTPEQTETMLRYRGMILGLIETNDQLNSVKQLIK